SQGARRGEVRSLRVLLREGSSRESSVRSSGSGLRRCFESGRDRRGVRGQGDPAVARSAPRGRAMKRALAVLLCVVLSSVFGSCAKAPKLRGQIAGLEKLTEQAERNGAVRC